MRPGFVWLCLAIRRHLTLLVVFLIIGGFLGLALAQSQSSASLPPQGSASVSNTTPCSTPAVEANFAVTPILDPAVAARYIHIPAGEPAIVAVVNGEQITAVDLEQRVNIAYALNQRTLKSLPQNAPASLRDGLQKTPAQLRSDLLNKMIDDILYLQEAKRLGISISIAHAQSEAQQQVNVLQSAKASSSVYNTLWAYLCVNHLTPSTFAKNPLVLQGYQKSLTMEAMNQYIIARLPASSQGNQTATQQAIAAYKQQLRRSAHIQLYISLQ